MTKIILDTSDEAASYTTGISGWVDRNGRFFGTNERAARWSGATHVECADCKTPVTKGRYLCEKCSNRKQTERYQALECVEWDGETPLYSWVDCEYFFDAMELGDYLHDNECESDDLQLVLCEPVFLSPIDTDEWCGKLPEEGELPEEVADAINVLNEVIRKQGPVSWRPSNIAAEVKDNYKM